MAKFEQQQQFIIKNSAKYLRMNIILKLNRKEHFKKKRKELDIRYEKCIGC